jgi:hypothetical protein
MDSDNKYITQLVQGVPVATDIMPYVSNPGGTPVTKQALMGNVPVAPGTSGNLLTSNGSVWTSATPTPVYTHSEIKLTSTNGYGSTYNKIRRWTNVEINVGTGMTLTQSSTDGDSIAINEEGIYGISFVDGFTSASAMGISKNSNQLTTAIVSITAAHRKGITQTPAANLLSSCAVTLFLEVGDVIRCHTSGTAEGTGVASSYLQVTKT